MTTPPSTSASLPRVTLAFISCERLHYLRATLTSARACIEYPNLEWIVVDDDSEEPGLKDYLNGCTWLDHRIFRRQTHAEAMNRIIEIATGEFVLIWPEDVQFITSGPWLCDLVALLQANRDVGSVCLDAQRLCTLESIHHPPFRERFARMRTDLRRFGPGRIRRRRKILSTNGFALWSYGACTEGVVGSGIPSLTRTAVWRTLGPWRTAGSGEGLIDSSLGAEDDMVARARRSGLRLQMAGLQVPVAADIINDDIGCKAKVRKGVRYGRYTAPPDPSGVYYAIRPYAERLRTAPSEDRPLSFSESVEPLGFRIPVDTQGDRLKAAFNETPRVVVRAGGAAGG